MGRKEIVASARRCVGVRFRAQGRDPALGMDCVGVAGVAFGREGLPSDYVLRGGEPSRIEAVIAELGLRRIGTGLAGEGDLVLLASGPGQLHFAVLTDSGFVHADARLRRVVETPGGPPWPVLGAWRQED